MLRIDGVKLIVRPVNPFPPEEEKPEEEAFASAQKFSHLYNTPDVTAPPSLDTDVSLRREE